MGKGGLGALCAVVLRIRDPLESVVCERRCKTGFELIGVADSCVVSKPELQEKV